MKVNPHLRAFNAGVLSPLYAARTDTTQHQAGCRVLDNWLPLPHGPATRRPGFVHVWPLADETAQGWLARFVFNREQAYVLEFTHQRLRFFTDDGILLDGAVPYELATPWAAADLTTASGTFALDLAQSGDVVWIAGGGRAPRELRRHDVLDWELVEFSPDDGPFLPENKGTATIHADAATGTVTLTASTATFTAGHVGALLRLLPENPDMVRPWVARSVVGTGDERRHDGRVYRAVVGGENRGVPPIHTEGEASDGTVTWAHVHPGFGVVRLTAVTSATSATATVVAELPSLVVGSGNATRRWQWGAWSDAAGWPCCVTFYLGRLAFAGGRRAWLSRAGDFSSFAERTTAIEVLTDDAISEEVTADQVVDIRWLRGTQAGLILGAEAVELVMASLTETEPFGADNKSVVAITDFGQARITPERVPDQRVLAVQAARRAVVVFGWELQRQGLAGDDLSVIAEHLLHAGVVDIAWQQRPDGILWLALADGSLVGLTYLPAQEVIAWHRHNVGGNGAVEAVEVIPKPDGDQLWAIIRRTVAGTVRRHVERLAPRRHIGEPIAERIHVDSALVAVRETPTTALTGLDHLEGEEVIALTDGATHPAMVVEGGAVTLQWPSSHIVVGLRFASILEPMDFEVPGRIGTGQGRLKRVRACVAHVAETMGLRLGRDAATAEPLVLRSPETPLGEPEEPASGKFRLDVFPDDWAREVSLHAVVDGPGPATLLALAPELEVTE